jgi:hypothetical protein
VCSTWYVSRFMTINRTWSRAMPRRYGGSLAESSGGREKEKGVDIMISEFSFCGLCRRKLSFPTLLYLLLCLFVSPCAWVELYCLKLLLVYWVATEASNCTSS